MPIGKISKIKYFLIEDGGKTAIELLFIGAVVLISLLFTKGTVLSEESKQKDDVSLFSASVSFSQEDYKKGSCTNLAEDNIRQGLGEGAVSVINNEEVVTGFEEEQNIRGQDFVDEASSSQNENDKREAEEYYVKEGDTLSTVASKFGISMQTILWANNLDALSVIHPGDKLTIPPEDGVMYTVKLGDTLLAIANRYGCDSEKIASFNQLDKNNIVEGQVLFLPGGKKPSPQPSNSSGLASSFSFSSPLSGSSSSYLSSSRSSSSYSTPTVRYGGGSHRFPYGYCTWYVAQRRGGVPWGGNASAWLSNASAAGYATGSQPVPGAIMVTRESWWGHVAYVESVSGNSVTVSEMNMRGWGIVSRRTLSNSNWVIRGYIY